MIKEVSKQWELLPRQERIDLLVFALEDKYGNLAKADDADPWLMMLHDIFGIKPQHSPYCKEKVEMLRVEQGYTRAGLSAELGYARTWYTNFLWNTIFNQMHAKKFSKVFGVHPEYFIK